MTRQNEENVNQAKFWLSPVLWRGHQATLVREIIIFSFSPSYFPKKEVRFSWFLTSQVMLYGPHLLQVSPLCLSVSICSQQTLVFAKVTWLDYVS